MKSRAELDGVVLDSLLVAAKETLEHLESLRIKFNREKKQLDAQESLASEIATRLSKLAVSAGLLKREEAFQCADLESLQGLVIERLVRDMLTLLTPRQGQILLMIYGIGTDRKPPLGDVAKRFSLSRSTISRLHRKALESLRNRVHDPRKDWQHSRLLQAFVKRLNRKTAVSHEEPFLISVLK